VPVPNLAVVSVLPQVQNNCQNPQPAFIAQVSIKNSGGPLPGGKGTLFVKETGGANLGSAGIQLPPFRSNETKQIAVPAITTIPYAQLPGRHQVQVILNPLNEGGKESFDKPAAPFRFSVAFPAGFCQPQQRLAPAASQVQVQPQPVSPPVPGRSSLPMPAR
jgi:hypothetical protein